MMWQARVSGCFAVAMLVGISACSTVPVGGRARIIDVPLAAVQSDLEFSLMSASRSYMSCAENLACPSDAGQGETRPFDQEVARIASTLQAAAMSLYPDLLWCTPKSAGGCFDVYVVEDDEAGSSSSANGRIALNSGLEKWQSYDGVLAFVIAREMGHVIARHHQERSSVSIVTSVLLNFLIPGSGVLKSLISTGGARFAAASNRDVQVTEADLIAFNLLKGSGFRLRNVSRSLLAVPALGDEDSWVKGFSRSSNKLHSVARIAESSVATVRNGKAPLIAENSTKLAQ